MTLKGEMALAIVRAILARPEKVSRGLAEAAARFDKYWRGPGEVVTSGEDYWTKSPGACDRFPKDCIPWNKVQELLPEDYAEKLLDN